MHQVPLTLHCLIAARAWLLHVQLKTLSAKEAAAIANDEDDGRLKDDHTQSQMADEFFGGYRPLVEEEGAGAARARGRRSAQKRYEA